MIQFLWYVIPILRKKAQVAALQWVAVRRLNGNVVVVTLTAVIFSFLSPPFFFSVAWQDSWPDIVGKRDDTVIQFSWYVTHILRKFDKVVDLSQTLSEIGMLQWHSLLDLSHTLSENGMIRLSWYFTNIDRKFNKVVDLVCNRHCWKIGQFRYISLFSEMKKIIHNTYTYIFYY